MSNKYVDVVYDPKVRPLTGYPSKLTGHLVERFGLERGARLLDMGCGRGEFAKGFADCGLDVYAVDMSDGASGYFEQLEVRCADLCKEPVPYDDASFDYVYSKSFLEHFYYPEDIVREVYRVLRPGGLVITMTPDWHSNYKGAFYEDYTHRTPFTRTSLRDIFLIHGFEDVRCVKFFQLPFVWKGRWLEAVPHVVRNLTFDGCKKHSKLIRFSKEIMLLCSARKPMES